MNKLTRKSKTVGGNKIQDTTKGITHNAVQRQKEMEEYRRKIKKYEGQSEEANYTSSLIKILERV